MSKQKERRYDMEDFAGASDPDFWRMIQERRKHGHGIPLVEIEARLRTREKKETQLALKKVRGKTVAR